MVRATQSLSQIPTQAQVRIATAAHVLAQLRARNAVKAELRKQGLKVSHYAAREISSWAQVYLDEHPELIANASACGRGLDTRGRIRQASTTRLLCVTYK